MPPRAARVPFSRGEHRDFAIPESVWSRFEELFGRELPATARDQMSKATAHYVDMASAERAAPSALPARDRLARVRKLATDLLTELDKRNSLAPGCPEFYADELIYFNLQHPGGTTKALRPGQEHLLLAPVAADLERLVAACDAAAAEWEQGTPLYWREGSAWDKWIVALSDILESHGVSAGASETVTVAANKVSPFIAFVAALQETLPADLRRSTWSLIALMGAIKRAREGTRKPARKAGRRR